MSDVVQTQELHNVSKCKTCSKYRRRIEVGRFDAKNKKFKDEFGLLWNGRKYCGQCNLDRVRAKMTEMRIKRKAQQIVSEQPQG